MDLQGGLQAARPSTFGGASEEALCFQKEGVVQAVKGHLEESGGRWGLDPKQVAWCRVG